MHVPSEDNQMLLPWAQPCDIPNSQRALMVICLFAGILGQWDLTLLLP